MEDVQYDLTAGHVAVEDKVTGQIFAMKWVGYNPATGMVTVEADYQFLIEVPGDRVYVPEVG